MGGRCSTKRPEVEVPGTQRKPSSKFPDPSKEQINHTLPDGTKLGHKTSTLPSEGTGILIQNVNPEFDGVGGEEKFTCSCTIDLRPSYQSIHVVDLPLTSCGVSTSAVNIEWLTMFILEDGVTRFIKDKDSSIKTVEYVFAEDNWTVDEDLQRAELEFEVHNDGNPAPLSPPSPPPVSSSFVPQSPSEVTAVWFFAAFIVLCVFGFLFKITISRWRRICCRQKRRTMDWNPKLPKVTPQAIPTILRKRKWRPSAQIAASSKLPMKTSITKTSMEPEALPAGTPKLVRGPTVPPFQMFPRYYGNSRSTTISAVDTKDQSPDPDVPKAHTVVHIE